MWSIQNLSAVYVILASTFPISIMNVHWCHLVHCEVKMFTSQCTKWLWTLALLQAQLVKRGWRLNISPRRCLSDETNMFCFYIFNQWNHFLQTDVQNGKWLCAPNTSYATLNLKLSSFVVKPCPINGYRLHSKSFPPGNRGVLWSRMTGVEKHWALGEPLKTVQELWNNPAGSNMPKQWQRALVKQ